MEGRKIRIPADTATLEGSLAKKLDGYEELVIEYNGASKETIEMKDDGSRTEDLCSTGTRWLGCRWCSHGGDTHHGCWRSMRPSISMPP